MVKLSEMLDQIMQFSINNWYFFLIIALIIAVVIAIIKINKLKSKEPKFYNQIEKNKETLINELRYNPTEIKFIKHFDKKYKVLGQAIYGWVKYEKKKKKQKIQRRYTLEEIRDFELYEMKKQIEQSERPKHIVHVFAIQREKFLGLFYKKPIENLILIEKDFTQIKHNEIRLHTPKSLLFIKGLLTTRRYLMIDIINEITERLMSDHYVNARGQQMKDFSRIRTDYAHIELMKDKDIQAEETKERAKRHG